MFFIHGFYRENAGNLELSFDVTYRNYFIISICGIPGSVVAMYVVDGRLGRKGTMAVSTFLTSGAMLLFSLLKTADGQLAASCIESFLMNILYGALYSYTPEVFPAEVRIQ